MTLTRRWPMVALLAAMLLTLVPQTDAWSGETLTSCSVSPGEAAGGEGGGSGSACPIAYVYVEPGDTVVFDVPSPFDRTASVAVATRPEAGTLTQLGGVEWRYAAPAEPTYQYAWFRVCSSTECAEVKVVLKVKDLSAPDTVIVEGPPATTLETVAEFVVEATEDDVYFKCSLDGAAWAKCYPPLRFDGLGVGTHVLKVKAVDLDGNYDETPAVHEWRIGDGSFHDDESSVHEANIEKIAASGITRGCTSDGTKFCPDAEMTRGQFAAFVNRALDLPAADRDYFSDDDDSIFEADINRFAAAGFTAGCNAAGTSYCPDEQVTRGQIAAFISRILELPAGGDAFGDDDGSTFERDINALAAAGITSGCGSGSYCPDRDVTRGEFASLFVRAGFTD